MRRLTHALDPAGEDDIGFATANEPAANGGGLDARSAQPVDDEGRRLDRDAAPEADVPRGVDGVGARLHDIADDDVVHGRGVDAAPLHGGSGGNDAEIGGSEVLERSHVLRHGRAGAGHDEDGEGT